jgi:hypothetical protein
MNFIITLLIKLISTELTKTIIGFGVNKLLEAKGDGITKDIASVMIDGIAKSKSNPTTNDIFKDATLLLK